jgi:hypothetical protein
MGKKATGYYTPKQLAAIRKKVAVNYTPEQLAAMQRIMAKHSPEERAKLDMMHERLDHAIAVSAGLIPPPWAEKLLKPATEPKGKPKRTRKGKQMSRLLPVLRDLYPPDGMPPDHVKTVKVVQTVLDEYKARKMGEVSRDVIERAIGRRES